MKVLFPFPPTKQIDKSEYLELFFHYHRLLFSQLVMTALQHLSVLPSLEFRKADKPLHLVTRKS